MNNAHLYAKSNNLQRRDAHKCLKEYSSKIKWKNNFSMILDIGCGDGSVTEILKKYIPTDFKLLGCDRSENMVKFANDHYFDEQTSFTVLNIEGHLPESMKGKFDHVFSFHVIHWIMDQELAFNNIYSMLEEGGECFMIFQAYIAIFDAYRALARTKKWCPYMKDVELYVSPYRDAQMPESEVRKLAEKVGFVDVDVTCQNFSYVYEDMDAFESLLKAVNPFKIPTAKYDDFMNDYIESLKDLQVIDKFNNKSATFNYRILIFHARKPIKSE